MSNIQALIEVIQDSNELQIDKLQESLSWQEMLVDAVIDVHKAVEKLHLAFVGYFDFEKERAVILDQRALEAQREAGGAATGAPLSVAPEEAAAVPEGEGLGFGFASVVTALTAAVSGYFVGLIKTLGQGFKDLGGRLLKGFKNLEVKVIPDSLKNMGTSIMKSIRGIGAGLLMQFDVLKASIADSKMFQSISSIFQNTVTKIKDFFKPLTEIPKIFSLGGEGGKVSKFIDGVFDTVKSIGGYFGKIFTGISKLAAPITAIIGLFNAGSATLEEVNEETSLLGGVLIGLKNLVKEMVSAFVTMPLELIKDIISWVAGAFGFENVEKALDSFDIDAMFREGFDFIIELVQNLLNFIGDKIYEGRKNLPGFLGGIDEDNLDPEAEMRIAQREVTSASQDVAAIPMNEQNMDNPEYVEAMERYNEAVANRDRVQQQFGTADVREVGDQGSQDQQQVVIKELANKMQDAGVRAFSVDELKEGGKPLDAKLKGGVPVEIDGTPVPRELYTAEQLQKVEQAESSDITAELYRSVVSAYTDTNTQVTSNVIPFAPRAQPTQSFISSSNEMNSTSQLTVPQGEMVLPVSASIASAMRPTIAGPLAAPVGTASRDIASRQGAAAVVVSAPTIAPVNSTMNNVNTTVVSGAASSRSSDPTYMRIQNNGSPV